MNEKFLLVILFANYVGSDMEGFIVDGEYADIKQYSHQVLLSIQGVYKCICAGSILNQIIVLTAAHCLEDMDHNHNKIAVFYGSVEFNNMKKVDGNAYIIHEYYDEESMEADVALIRCKTPMRLGRFAKKIAIMQNPPSWKISFVSGWGVPNEKLKAPDFLRHTKQQLQTYRVCSVLEIPKGAFCTSSYRNEGYPSTGDSGGALIINEYIQVGIVSYKLEDYRLVSYTNVSYYYGWIFRKARTLYCKT